MKQTITVSFRASNKGAEKKIQEYEKEGWKVISKERGSWWGKMGSTYNWRLVLEREDTSESEKDESEKSNKENVVDQLVKLKKLLDEGAINQEEYEILKKRILNQEL